MKTTRVSIRIALLTLGALVLFLGSLIFAMVTLRGHIDHSAEREAIRYVETRLVQLQEAFAAVTVDYGRWDDAWMAAQTGDLEWIYDNMAVGADEGTVFDGVTLFSGPLRQPLSWQVGGGSTPQDAFLPGTILAIIHDRVDTIPLGEWGAITDLVLVDGQLALLAATHVQPLDETLSADSGHPDMPVFLAVRLLGDEALGGIEAALTLSDLTYAAAPLPGATTLEVTGVGGRRLGFLNWQTRKPATEVIIALWPVLLMVGLGLIVLTLLAAALLRANALRLMSSEAQARELAHRDPLTGLPNRLAMNRRVQLRDSVASGPQAILYIDLNGFKRVNDMLGHAVGDQIVAEVGRRLAALGGAQDFVARVGGDEFVFLPGACADPEGRARHLANRVATEVAGGFQPDGRRIHVSASIGLALDQTGKLPLLELVRRADLAMLHAKRDRRGGVCVYSPEIEAIAVRNDTVEMALRDALASGEEFSVHYQPIVNATDGSLVRAEALARWNSPQLGPIRPDIFIGLAEASGLINTLGRHLLTRIADDLASCPALEVSLNISPLQLEDPTFITELTECAHRHGIDPARVEIEVTESVLIDDPDAAALRLDGLHEAGFSTAIDDFGTGFSSLGALRRMPFRTLKIDRSFVMGDDEALANADLIEGIVQIGHAMGQAIVCEGVESARQAELLARLGCDLLQGYHFGRPMPLATLIGLYPELAPADGRRLSVPSGAAPPDA